MEQRGDPAIVAMESPRWWQRRITIHCPQISLDIKESDDTSVAADLDLLDAIENKRSSTDAMQLAERALANIKYLDPESPLRVRAAFAKSKLHFVRREMHAALQHAHEAFERSTHILGESSLDTLQIQCHLALVHEESSELSEAEVTRAC